MYAANLILSALSVLGFIIFGFLFKFYLPSYLKKKAENLATKEDIHHLTEVVEGIKAKYATDLEVFRAELAKVNQVQQIQFEKEFDTYVKIMKRLVVLKRETFALRPQFDYLPGTPDSNEQERKQRLGNFAKAFGAFSIEAHQKRPFYSPAIWGKLQILLTLSSYEADEYQFNLIGIQDKDYWAIAKENKDKILSLIEELVETIRGRFDELKAVK